MSKQANPEHSVWPERSGTGELLARARDGDGQATEALLARHREGVRHMIQVRLDPAIARRVDASDVAQDVLLEASRRLPEYLRKPVMPFHLWLRHIAKDHIIDAHRRHRRAQRRTVEREQPLDAHMDSSAPVVPLAAAELTPATASIRRELERNFQRALAALADDDREIILMRHYEGLSNQDVAESLGLTEAAASMRYIRALRRLRQSLVNEPGVDKQ